MIGDLNLDEFTNEQNLIIRQLCQIQLESLKRIQDNNDLSGEDITMLLIQENVSKEVFLENILDKVERYEDLHDDPENLKVLGTDDLSMFRHLLTNVENIYNEDYPKAVSNLWNRLFLIEHTQNLVNYGLLLNN
jgi:hypothetical protein